MPLYTVGLKANYDKHLNEYNLGLRPQPPQKLGPRAFNPETPYPGGTVWETLDAAKDYMTEKGWVVSDGVGNSYEAAIYEVADAKVTANVPEDWPSGSYCLCEDAIIYRKVMSKSDLE